MAIRISHSWQRECRFHRNDNVIFIAFQEEYQSSLHQSTHKDDYSLFSSSSSVIILNVFAFFPGFCINHSQDFSFYPEGSLRLLLLSPLLYITVTDDAFYLCRFFFLFVLIGGYR